ncbi:MAG: hypothetical protein ABJF10_25970 [Chthoniobacter sp.]|uniref:hypothetical protein n=1 Tax=Chthoniobacter sp. TaxID=2510640 RepID=UPI0032AC9BCA
MSQVTPQMMELAARLVAQEMGSKDSSGPAPPAAFHVCEKLRPYLSTLMGKAGFQAVLSRALAVASVKTPWLKAVQVKADGALEGWDQPEAQVAAKELTEGCVLLVSHLLGLLDAFIGHHLTLRMVRDVWPKLSLEDSQFTPGDQP